MLQVFVTCDAFQFILDNLFDVLLDLIVIVQNSLLHAVVAIGILEIVNDRDWLIMTFLSLYFVGVNDNLGMENLLLYAIGEVVGNSSNKHTLGEFANLAWRNETVHLGIDGCRDILTVDGNRLALLEHLCLLVSIITNQLREVLEAQADGNYVASCRGNQVIQAFEIDGRQL